MTFPVMMSPTPPRAHVRYRLKIPWLGSMFSVPNCSSIAALASRFGSGPPCLRGSGSKIEVINGVLTIRGCRVRNASRGCRAEALLLADIVEQAVGEGFAGRRILPSVQAAILHDEWSKRDVGLVVIHADFHQFVLQIPGDFPTEGA